MSVMDIMMRGFLPENLTQGLAFLQSPEGLTALRAILTDQMEARRDVSIIYASMLRRGDITDADIRRGITRCVGFPGLEFSARNGSHGAGVPAIAGSSSDDGGESTKSAA